MATLLLAATPAAHGTVVTYTDFSSTAGLTLVGSTGTAVTGDGTVLRLTGAAGSQSGAAYSTSAIALGAGATFSTTFQFRFTNPGGIDPADGITFVLAKNPSGLGGSGVGMGYSGVPNSVAIELDTYNNRGFGLGADDGNSSNHMSVDTNGSLTNSALHNVYGNQSCGFPSGSPSQSLYTAFGCMSNGDLWTVTISYDGSTKLLNATIQDGLAAVDLAISNYLIDLPSILGAGSAYVGFTSGTGAGWENHDILNWRFADTTELAHGVPSPAGWLLLLMGLPALTLARAGARSRLR